MDICLPTDKVSSSSGEELKSSSSGSVNYDLEKVTKIQRAYRRWREVKIARDEEMNFT